MLHCFACSVLDSDHNGYLDFKEFQQAIDLVGARLPDDRWAVIGWCQVT